jgi:hypothetical protein
MPFLIGAVLSGTALALNAPQFAPASGRDRIVGIFSNVQQSPETGDLGGVEIEFHPQATPPYAIVVVCEGWCNQAHRAPVKLEGQTFSLSFDEPLFDMSGAIVAQDHYRIDGRLAGDAVLVDLRLNSNNWHAKLKRIPSRIGLDVAEPPDAEGSLQ